jgi:aromatic ring-opening dioxygenase catalytic subunit (LigB family)
MLIDEQRGDFTEMIEALTVAADTLAADEPAAIVCVSARWRSAGPFQADDAPRHGSLIDQPGWGVNPRYDCTGHTTLARALLESGSRRGLRVGAARRGADSGVAIPLHFLARERRVPVVPVSLSAEAGREQHRTWGAALRESLNEWPERVAFVVGGAITFNEHAFNLRREQSESLEVDEHVLGVLRRGTWSDLAAFPPALAERAMPEADLLHLEVLRGFLFVDAPGHVLAYETSPGIGAALVEFPLPPGAR